MDYEFWNNIIKQLQDIDKISKKEKNVKKALKFINKVMNTDIFPQIYNKHKTEILKYYKKRNKYNKKVDKVSKKVLKELELAFKNFPHKYEFHIMSSFKAKTNLIGESDVDVGLLIENLDEKKLFEAIKILNEIEYKYVHILETNINKYYSFEKIVSEIEIEVKIRDLKQTESVLLLHNYLDTKLTDKERAIITYSKYILKKIDKNAYKLIKSMCYNMYFYYIKNSFII